MNIVGVHVVEKSREHNLLLLGLFLIMVGDIVKNVESIFIVRTTKSTCRIKEAAYCDVYLSFMESKK